MQQILSVHNPHPKLPLVFDSPHSGITIPEDFKSICKTALLNTAIDRYVNELFASAPDEKACLLEAHFPRYYIDLNRAIDDIDPLILENKDAFPDKKPTAWSNAGIGLIWRTIKPEKNIYNKALKEEHISNRIETFYRPYHKKLRNLIEKSYEEHGIAYHINCHSMPHRTSFPKRKGLIYGHSPRAADFCLGTRDGTTCEKEFVRAMRLFLSQMGYHVTVNDPFKGVEIIKRHGRPTQGFHSLQLEINRALYMDEITGQKSNNFNALKADIEKLIQFCADYVKTKIKTS